MGNFFAQTPSKHRANTEQTPSKEQENSKMPTFVIINQILLEIETQKIIEDDNELWPNISLPLDTYISINTGITRGPVYPPPL